MADTPKLETLKDFKIIPKSWASAMANAGRKYNIDIDDLRQLIIKWIKEIRRLKDVGWQISGGGIEEAKYRGTLRIIPNGQQYEDWAEASDLNGAEKVLIDIFNIKEDELK